MKFKRSKKCDYCNLNAKFYFIAFVPRMAWMKACKKCMSKLQENKSLMVARITRIYGIRGLNKFFKRKEKGIKFTKIRYKGRKSWRGEMELPL